MHFAVTTASVRDSDGVARIGGDEFALIVLHCAVEEALGAAPKILEAKVSMLASRGR
jgi:GGDEF domain-containing protein